MEEAVEPVTLKLASIWQRLAAFIIDYLLVNFILSIIIALVIVIGFGDEGPAMVERGDALVRDLSESWGPAQLLIIVGYWLYFAIMHSSAWGGTVGKRFMSIYVADEEGDRITFITASLRFLGKFTTLGLGFILALFHPRRQALYDLIAKTYVYSW